MPTEYDIDAAYKDWLQLSPRLSWQEIADRHGFPSAAAASTRVYWYSQSIAEPTKKLPLPIRSFVESLDYKAWRGAKGRLINTLIHNPQWRDVDQLKDAVANGDVLRNPNVGRVLYVMLRFTFGLPSVSIAMDKEYKRLEELGLKQMTSAESSR